MFNAAASQEDEDGTDEVENSEVMENEDKENVHDNSQKPSYRRVLACVRLLKPYQIAEPKEMKPVERNTSLINVNMALPLDWQVYQMIRASGSTGITAREIDEQLGGIEKKMSEKLLSNLVAGTDKDFLVRRVSEFAGRERRYRYFAGRVERIQ